MLAQTVIIETMKVYPEIDDNKFLKEFRRRVRIWSQGCWWPCKHATNAYLEDIIAQGFIKRRSNEHGDDIFVSDFDNKKYIDDEDEVKPPVVVSFALLERAELDSTSSLQSLQVALNRMRPNADPRKVEPLKQAGEKADAYLDALQAAVSQARAALDNIEPDPQKLPGHRTEQQEEIHRAFAKLCTGLAQFEQKIKDPKEVITATKSQGYAEYHAATSDVLLKVIPELRSLLEELKAEMDTAQAYIKIFREYSIENSGKVTVETDRCII